MRCFPVLLIPCGLRRCGGFRKVWHNMVAVGFRRVKGRLVYLLKNSWVDPYQWLLFDDAYLQNLRAAFSFLPKGPISWSQCAHQLAANGVWYNAIINIPPAPHRAHF